MEYELIWVRLHRPKTESWLEVMIPVPCGYSGELISKYLDGTILQDYQDWELLTYGEPWPDGRPA
mgnify:CR=1 FL=1|jgi:hypothetical protein